MKLTHLRAGRDSADHLELVVELDGLHYEAERFRPDIDAIDLALRFRQLAARIERRAGSAGVAAAAPPNIEAVRAVVRKMAGFSSGVPYLQWRECVQAAIAALDGVATGVPTAWRWKQHEGDDWRHTDFRPQRPERLYCCEALYAVPDAGMPACVPAVDVDGEPVTPQRLLKWLDVKFSRHGEEEDKWAADYIRATLGVSKERP